MRKSFGLVLALALLLCAPVFGASNALVDGRIAHVEEHHIARRVWYASIAAAFAGQTLDCVSSIGWGYEANPMMRGSNGQFSPAKGIPIKLGMVGAIAGFEYLSVRRGNPRYKTFTAINSIIAGEGLFAAAHNFSTRPEGK